MRVTDGSGARCWGRWLVAHLCRAGRALAVALLALLAAGAPGQAAALGEPDGWVELAAPALPGEGPRPPVILVHGLGGSPAATWGLDATGAGTGGTLVQALERQGYVLHDNLFLLDYSHRADDDFLAVALEELVPLLEAVHRGRGEPAVDIVGNSMGGLVARAAAASSLVPVRHVITIGTPHRGAHLAHLGRLQAELERQWQRYTQGWAGVTSSDPLQPADHVTVRARDVYLPLVQAFVHHVFTLPPGGQPTRFLEWLAVHAPADYGRLFTAEALAVSSAPVPPEGASLSAGYLELLALHAGKHVAGGGLPLAVRADSVPAAAGGRLARTPLWTQALYRLVTAVAGFIQQLGRAPESSGWRAGVRFALGVDLLGPGVMRLIPHDVPLAGGSDDRVPANRFLVDWNGGSAEGAAGRPLLTTFAGDVVHPGRLLFPAAFPGDLVVEQSSALLDPGPLDVARVVRGGRRGEHFRMLADPGVVELILRRLAAALPADEVQYLPPGGGRRQGSFMAAAGELGGAAFRAPPGGRGSWHGTVASPDGLPVDLRIYARPARGASDGATERWAYWELAEADRDVAVDPVTWHLPARAWEAVVLTARYPAVLGDARVAYAVTYLEGDEGPMAGPGLSGTSFPAGMDAPGQAGPLIDAVYRSRMTTTKRERIERHEVWHWSFGDGREEEIVNPGLVESVVQHRFAEPGGYEVTARSLTAFGRTIVLHRWHVTVGPEDVGALHSFTARTVPPPAVELSLTGPAAWPINLPASFGIELEVGAGPGVDVHVWHHPGERFQVRWAKPGLFTVRGAVTLRFTADIEGKQAVLWQTHVVEERVEVVATSMVD